MLGAGGILGTSLATPFFLITMATSIGIPGAIGEFEGRQSASDDFAAFQDGCDQPAKNYWCVELKKDGRTISKVFLIDSSTKPLAIFDVATNSSRVLERTGTEYIADISKLYPSKRNKK